MENNLMSIKKNIGVLVLLLVLLSMSAVSAEDVSINANDTYQTPNEIKKISHLYKQTLIILKVYLSLLMMSNMEMMK